jgi:protocadherin-16/23
VLSGGNLTYEIPKGIADDSFTVDPLRGIVTTKGTFDRETKDMFTVPIYVMESMTTQFKAGANGKSNKLKSQFDVATIVIRITDVNDHAPEFRPGSCYPLAIPENSDLSIVHQVVATDLDEGPNGDITYSITGMKIRFSLSSFFPTKQLRFAAMLFLILVLPSTVRVVAQPLTFFLH